MTTKIPAFLGGLGLDARGVFEVSANATVITGNVVANHLGDGNNLVIGFNSLSDVNVPGAAEGDSIVFEGGQWVPGAAVPANVLIGSGTTNAIVQFSGSGSNVFAGPTLPGFAAIDEGKDLEVDSGGNIIYGPKRVLDAITDPTPDGQDLTAGFTPGSVWINTSNETAWICVASTVYAGPGSGGIWINVSEGGGGALNLTDDTSTDSNNFYPLLVNNQTTGDLENVSVSSTKIYFNPNSGTLNATEYNSLSDAAYKVNIKSIDSALDIICSLRGVSFDWKETGAKSYGLIAQEVKEIIPDVVTSANTLNYMAVIGFLVEAVKELRNAKS
jgi:hypothetical protein